MVALQAARKRIAVRLPAALEARPRGHRLPNLHPRQLLLPQPREPQKGNLGRRLLLRLHLRLLLPLWLLFPPRTPMSSALVGVGAVRLPSLALATHLATKMIGTSRQLRLQALLKQLPPLCRAGLRLRLRRQLHRELHRLHGHRHHAG